MNGATYGYDIKSLTVFLIEANIRNLLGYYRATWPHKTVTPKLHLLEDHCVDFMLKWRSAFGTYGEQGAESLHATFNSMKISYRSMQPPIKRVTAMLKEHYMRVNPAVAVLRPEVPKRVKIH